MVKKTLVVSAVVMVLAALVAVFGLSLKGYIPLNYTQADTLPDLDAFLDSPRDDMQAIKINGHFLEIGKRRALQILPGYKGVFYLVRPYRQIQYRPRNMTRAEIVDMCLSISGKDLEALKADSLKRAANGKGVVDGRPVQIFRITQFTYMISGLSDKPQFMAQVELAKRLGMSDTEILTLLIPVQTSWIKDVQATLHKPNTISILPEVPDGVSPWLNARL